MLVTRTFSSSLALNENFISSRENRFTKYFWKSCFHFYLFLLIAKMGEEKEKGKVDFKSRGKVKQELRLKKKNVRAFHPNEPLHTNKQKEIGKRPRLIPGTILLNLGEWICGVLLNYVLETETTKKHFLSKARSSWTNLRLNGRVLILNELVWRRCSDDVHATRLWWSIHALKAAWVCWMNIELTVGLWGSLLVICEEKKNHAIVQGRDSSENLPKAGGNGICPPFAIIRYPGIMLFSNCPSIASAGTNGGCP